MHGTILVLRVAALALCLLFFYDAMKYDRVGSHITALWCMTAFWSLGTLGY